MKIPKISWSWLHANRSKDDYWRYYNSGNNYIFVLVQIKPEARLFFIQAYLWLSCRRSTDGEGPANAKGVVALPLLTAAIAPKCWAVAVELLALWIPPHNLPALPSLGLVWVGWFSTGFLERFRPRCMWRSQYFCPATTSLEHLHFFPSVLLHLPGSGSMEALPQYADCNTVTK